MNMHHHPSVSASEAVAQAAQAAAVASSGHHAAGHHAGHSAAGGPANNGSSPSELSFEDFTAMSPFLDPAALHLANPYASASLASSAAVASSGKKICKSCISCEHIIIYYSDSSRKIGRL